MMQIQGTLKLLSYEIERNPNKWKGKVASNQIEPNRKRCNSKIQ